MTSEPLILIFYTSKGKGNRDVKEAVGRELCKRLLSVLKAHVLPSETNLKVR
jgi:hypothetical protein